MFHNFLLKWALKSSIQAHNKTTEAGNNAALYLTQKEIIFLLHVIGIVIKGIV